MKPAHSGASPRPRRGEIWWVALDPTVGSETRKTRPCLVVSTDSLARLPVRIVVPLTKWQAKHARRPWCVRVDPDKLNGLSAPSAADAVQIRCVSLERFRKRAGAIDASLLEGALAAAALCLDLSLSGT